MRYHFNLYCAEYDILDEKGLELATNEYAYHVAMMLIDRLDQEEAETGMSPKPLCLEIQDETGSPLITIAIDRSN